MTDLLIHFTFYVVFNKTLRASKVREASKAVSALFKSNWMFSSQWSVIFKLQARHLKKYIVGHLKSFMRVCLKPSQKNLFYSIGGGIRSYFSLLPPFCRSSCMISSPLNFREMVMKRSSFLPKLLLFNPNRRAMLQKKPNRIIVSVWKPDIFGFRMPGKCLFF